jgi:prepilin-type N-terminal cleavage/methylation domain-containing protein
MKTKRDFQSKTRGFTLIELLIVIAIILILIAIALPNFLEAQIRAKVTKEYGEMRSLATGIEALRVERGFLLVDFWDDDINGIKLARFGTPTSPNKIFGACCSWHNHDVRGGTTGLFTPLTTPVKYLTEVPPDPFFDTHDLGCLIPQDVLPPVTYMYLDREQADARIGFGHHPDDEFRGAAHCWSPDGRDGCTPAVRHVAPLKTDSYVLIGFGPDGSRCGPYDTPYNPTNGTKSAGDTLFRSDSGSNPGA